MNPVFSDLAQAELRPFWGPSAEGIDGQSAGNLEQPFQRFSSGDGMIRIHNRPPK
jgi:hypothetical protein